MPNYYEILGVERDATEEEIRTAYKRRVLEYHPDKNRHKQLTKKEIDTQRDLFLFVRIAREVLLNPTSRRLYDKNLEEDGCESDEYLDYVGAEPDETDCWFTDTFSPSFYENVHGSPKDRYTEEYFYLKMMASKYDPSLRDEDSDDAQEERIILIRKAAIKKFIQDREKIEKLNKILKQQVEDKINELKAERSRKKSVTTPKKCKTLSPTKSHSPKRVSSDTRRSRKKANPCRVLTEQAIENIDDDTRIKKKCSRQLFPDDHTKDVDTRTLSDKSNASSSILQSSIETGDKQKKLESKDASSQTRLSFMGIPDSDIVKLLNIPRDTQDEKHNELESFDITQETASTSKYNDAKEETLSTSKDGKKIINFEVNGVKISAVVLNEEALNKSIQGIIKDTPSVSTIPKKKKRKLKKDKINPKKKKASVKKIKNELPLNYSFVGSLDTQKKDHLLHPNDEHIRNYYTLASDKPAQYWVYNCGQSVSETDQRHITSTWIDTQTDEENTPRKYRCIYTLNGHSPETCKFKNESKRAVELHIQPFLFTFVCAHCNKTYGCATNMSKHLKLHLD